MANKIRDLSTDAIVLKRTNYGEADRILTLITPLGQRSAIAKSVRKEKSKLAGAVEPFTLAKMNLHEGRGELLVVTGVKVERFYSNVLKDFTRLEVASEVLKRVMRVSSLVDSPDYFDITKQSLTALDMGADIEKVVTWFYLNLAKASGEEINLHFDTDGEPLGENSWYVWDAMELGLKKEPHGKIAKNEIKMLRLMLAAKLSLVLRVKNTEEMMPELLYIAKTLNRL